MPSASGLHSFHVRHLIDEDSLDVKVWRWIKCWTSTCLVKCEERKMSTNDWPSEEIRSRKPAIMLSVMEVGQWPIGFGLVDPFGNQLKYFCPHFRRGDGCREELPIGLGV